MICCKFDQSITLQHEVCGRSPLTLTVDAFIRLPNPFHIYRRVLYGTGQIFHKDFNTNHTVDCTHEGAGAVQMGPIHAYSP